MLWVKATWLGTVLALAAAFQVQGDVLFLANGGRLEGELLNPEESPRQTYQLRTARGGRLLLAREQVTRAEVKSELERRYEALLPSLDDTVEAHWDMAERCGRAGLKEQRRFHLAQVLRHDPDHAAARRALGYHRIEGRWMRRDQWMKQRGYVRDVGGWRLPQDLARERQAEALEAQLVEWRKKLRMWRRWIVKGRERRAEGKSRIRGIRDPVAATALVELLEDDRQAQALKLIYIDALGSLESPVAVQALVQQALVNPDPQIRERCLDQLERTQPRSALEAFARTLKHKDNYMVQRAAVALERLNDPEAIWPLIEALVTEHKYVVGAGSNRITPTFSNRGSGLSMGGQQKIVTEQKKNDAALRALNYILNAVHPGVNFGFDEQAWKDWYVAEQTPSSLNLRRSK